MSEARELFEGEKTALRNQGWTVKYGNGNTCPVCRWTVLKREKAWYSPKGTAYHSNCVAGSRLARKAIKDGVKSKYPGVYAQEKRLAKKALNTGIYKDLPPSVFHRLSSVLHNPNNDTWDNAYSIVLPGGKTLWQYILLIDDSFTRGAGPDHGTTGKWIQVPDIWHIVTVITYVQSQLGPWPPRHSKQGNITSKCADAYTELITRSIHE